MLTVRPVVVFTDGALTNTAYGNALKVEAGTGGIARVSGGTFTINPTAPDDDRTGDTAPYAGIWIETVSGESVYLQDDVQISVTGENLHGIHLAESYSWLSSSGTVIEATGKDAVGVFTKGSASMRDGTINVEGENAKGISIEGGLADIQNVTMEVSGTGSIVGIDSQGGGLAVHAASVEGQPSLELKVTGVGADVNVTGIRISGNLSESAREINDASIVVANDDGDQTIGVHLHLAGLDEDQRFDLINTQIDVSGNLAAGRVSGVQIEAEHTEIGLTAVTLDVTGHDAAGVRLLAEGSSADIEAGLMTVTGDGAYGIKAEAQGATIYVRDGANVVVQGDAGVGISLENEGIAQISNTVVDVEGDNSIGFVLDNEGYVSMYKTGIRAQGDGSVGVRVANSMLWQKGFSQVEVTASGAQSIGFDAESSSRFELRDMKIDVDGSDSIALRTNFSKLPLERVQLIATGDGSTGIDARNSEVTLIDSDIDVDSGALPGHGIDAHESLIDLERGSLHVQGASSVRGVLSMGDDHQVNVAGTDVQARSTGGDAWALVSDGGGMSVTDNTTVVAEGVDGAFGIYGSGTVLTLAESTITARSNAMHATGVFADLGSTLSIADTDVLAEAGAGEVIAVSLAHVQDAQIIDGVLTAIGTDDAFTAAVDVKEGSSVSLKDGAAIAVQGGAGSGVGIVAADLDTYVDVSGAIIDVEGGYEGAGISAFDGAVVSLESSHITVAADWATGFYAEGGAFEVLDSHIQVTGRGTDPGYDITSGMMGSDISVSGSRFDVAGEVNAVGLVSYVGTFDVSDTDIKVTANQGEAYGIGMMETVVPAVLDAVRVSVSGVDDAAAILVGDKASVVVSGGSLLNSSHDGIRLLGLDDQLSIQLTDTEVVAGASTLAAIMDGEGTQRFNLSSGVVATVNDGTLLNVDRDNNVATGRVELNLSDGAVVAGAIRDNVGNLAELSADGGTYVSLNNASYMGSVQNVRSVSVNNGGHIGGGTVVLPNTVLENVSVDNGVFSGHWDIAGTFQARNQARVAPGNSIGVITAHSIDWGPGTIYQVEVNAAGESDRVDVTGPSAADISKTALLVDQEGGTGGYRLDHDYTILTAAGGIDGTFVSADWAGSELITVNPVYSADQINMSLSVDEQALHGASGTEDITFSTMGLRGATLLQAGDTAIRVQAGLGWRHAFGDRDPSTRLSFIEGGGSRFTVSGAPIARNTAVFDLGAEVQLGRNTSIGMSYEGQSGSGYTEHTGHVYLKARF